MTWRRGEIVRIGIGLLILISAVWGVASGCAAAARSDAPTEQVTSRPALPKELQARNEVPPLDTEEPPLATWETREGAGPLATWDPSTWDAFPDAASGQGTLNISDDCARLILPNQKVILLVWPEPTSWEPFSQTIKFVGPGGERVELRDGDQIVAGGVTATRHPQFVVPPNPSCEADELFIVNGIGLVAD